jgi:hypothetical protein
VILFTKYKDKSTCLCVKQVGYNMDAIFKKTMDTKHIKNIVKDIRATSDTLEEKTRTFTAKYPDFVEKYPKLFAAALNPDFPLQYFDMMIQQLDQLNNRTTTIDDADKVIYGKLREDYVEPLMKNAQLRGDADPQIKVIDNSAN